MVEIFRYSFQASSGLRQPPVSQLLSSSGCRNKPYFKQRNGGALTTIYASASLTAATAPGSDDAVPLPAKPFIPHINTARPFSDSHSKAAMTTVYTAAAMSTFMAALGRVSFSVLAVPIQQQYQLAMTDMGLVQSALLIGYFIGQVPAGLLSDRFGGPKTLCGGLVAWSIAKMSMAATPFVDWPLYLILGARGALGLAQSVMMPAVSASTAQFFPAAVRASTTSKIYAFYSLGTVAGFSLTPACAAALGWPAAFFGFGALGVVLGAMALRTLPPLPKEQQAQSDKKRISAELCWKYASDVALLCWTHAVIGFGFFVLQSWTPTFLHSLGVSNLTLLGVLTAVPWLCTAFVAMLAGRFADWLQTSAKWPVLRVRHAMQTTASLGAALAFLPLVLTPNGSLSPVVATISLCLGIAAQGFYYGGFHSYVQDVAPGDAGLILGLTNSCGIIAGIIINMATGVLADGPYGFAAVFGLTSLLHVLSAITWVTLAKGKRIYLSK